ncbi:MAG TPA: EamA family transporter, partial [Methylibium sp.]
MRAGYLYGLAGVLLFALTIPMTRLAGGSVENPQLPPDFVAIGRAAVAGLLALVWLAATRAPLPRRGFRGLLALSAAGAVFGFPLFLGWAVRHVEAVHAAVITGFLPLAT